MITVTGTNNSRIQHFKNLLGNMSPNDSFEIWISNKLPLEKCYCWWKISEFDITTELSKVKQVKTNVDIQIVVISDIKTHESLPNSCILIAQDNHIKSFYNENEIEKYIIESLVGV